MLPIAQILHPTDFSESSGCAWQLACALAHDYGARLVALHVMPPPTIVYGEGITPPEPEDAMRQVQAQLDHLSVPEGNVRAERQLVEGDAVTETLRIAREMPADLVVMGTHGRTVFERMLMGSVAEQILRKATCPVLTVKNPRTSS